MTTKYYWPINFRFFFFLSVLAKQFTVVILKFMTKYVTNYHPIFRLAFPKTEGLYVNHRHGFSRILVTEMLTLAIYTKSPF